MLALSTATRGASAGVRNMPAAGKRTNEGMSGKMNALVKSLAIGWASCPVSPLRIVSVTRLRGAKSPSMLKPS